MVKVRSAKLLVVMSRREKKEIRKESHRLKKTMSRYLIDFHNKQMEKNDATDR